MVINALTYNEVTRNGARQQNGLPRHTAAPWLFFLFVGDAFKTSHPIGRHINSWQQGLLSQEFKSDQGLYRKSRL